MVCEGIAEGERGWEGRREQGGVGRGQADGDGGAGVCVEEAARSADDLGLVRAEHGYVVSGCVRHSRGCMGYRVCGHHDSSISK